MPSSSTKGNGFSCFSSAGCSASAAADSSSSLTNAAVAAAIAVVMAPLMRSWSSCFSLSGSLDLLTSLRRDSRASICESISLAVLSWRLIFSNSWILCLKASTCSGYGAATAPLFPLGGCMPLAALPYASFRSSSSISRASPVPCETASYSSLSSSPEIGSLASIMSEKSLLLLMPRSSLAASSVSL